MEALKNEKFNLGKKKKRNPISQNDYITEDKSIFLFLLNRNRLFFIRMMYVFFHQFNQNMMTHWSLDLHIFYTNCPEINTSYLTDSCIGFTLKMESVSKKPFLA